MTDDQEIVGLRQVIAELTAETVILEREVKRWRVLADDLKYALEIQAEVFSRVPVGTKAHYAMTSIQAIRAYNDAAGIETDEEPLLDTPT